MEEKEVNQEENFTQEIEPSETKYCSNCGAVIDINAEICPKCGVRVEPVPESNNQNQNNTNTYTNTNIGTEQKNPGLAAVLSFFIIGVGQIYNGQIGKGIGMLIGGYLCFILSFLIIPAIIGLIIYIWGIYDAYDTAKKINSGEIIV